MGLTLILQVGGSAVVSVLATEPQHRGPSLSSAPRLARSASGGRSQTVELAGSPRPTAAPRPPVRAARPESRRLRPRFPARSALRIGRPRRGVRRRDAHPADMPVPSRPRAVRPADPHREIPP